MKRRNVSPKQRIVVMLSPALAVFLATFAVWYLTGYPEGLLLSRSIRGILVRFALVTLLLCVPVLALPGLLRRIASFGGSRGFFGRLVEKTLSQNQSPNLTVMWMLRPMQGIGLSLAFAERILQLFEYSVGTTPSRVLVRLSLFVLGSSLVSMLLSLVWALDDLGIRFYNEKSGEVRTAGSTVGTIVPIVTGVFGIAALFQHTDLTSALTDLLGISMVLYPPYVVFAIIHHEFVKRKIKSLSDEPSLKRLETRAF
jgi:hypothetical protein